MSFYYFPRLIIPKCNHKLFEEIAFSNPGYYQMNLIDEQLEIIVSPIDNKTSQKKAEIIRQVVNWCNANENLIGHYSSSRGVYTLSNGNMLGSDTSVVLCTRWNALSNDEKKKAFPQVSPNFIVELHSGINSLQYVHKKMEQWIKGGVDEGILIDSISNPSTVRMYTCDNTNSNIVIWQEFVNPQIIASQILPGFVMDIQEILQ
ncbi:hypothetical protein Glove_743g4 [Diversispora epigaea]|uniref:Putative restriction endonuclease domain-containing protein n=1 Tax=Diversispora epigaea TaxID=1348612 RepID=A0A397FZV5_9GLOM|nr:hypothetical protein Glove_743g4 [Diversispora epigaea]